MNIIIAMDYFNKNNGNKKSPWQAFVSGLVLCLVFGTVLRMTGLWIFIFPMIFAGILPAIEGFKRIRFNRTPGGNIDRELRLHKKKLKKVSPEKRILQIAKEEKGKVTPAIIALKSEIPMEKAEKILGNMAKKGHASMYVTENGHILYEFPDFKPQKMEKIE